MFDPINLCVLELDSWRFNLFATYAKLRKFNAAILPVL